MNIQMIGNWFCLLLLSQFCGVRFSLIFLERKSPRWDLVGLGVGLEKSEINFREIFIKFFFLFNASPPGGGLVGQNCNFKKKLKSRQIEFSEVTNSPKSRQWLR